MQRTKHCQDQLHYLTLAFRFYAQDYDGLLPDAPKKWGPSDSAWVSKLTPYNYSTSSYLCPSDLAPADTRAVYGIHRTSYVWNAAYSDATDGLNSPAGQSLARILKPQQTILLADGAGDYQFRWELKDGASLPPEGKEFRIGSIVGRHNGRPNVLFADGHVEANSAEQIFLPRTRNGKSYFAGLSIEDD